MIYAKMQKKILKKIGGGGGVEKHKQDIGWFCYSYSTDSFTNIVDFKYIYYKRFATNNN